MRLQRRVQLAVRDLVIAIGVEHVEQRLLLVEPIGAGEVDDREQRHAVDARARLVDLDQQVLRLDRDVLDADQLDSVRRSP